MDDYWIKPVLIVNSTVYSLSYTKTVGKLFYQTPCPIHKRSDSHGFLEVLVSFTMLFRTRKFRGVLNCFTICGTSGPLSPEPSQSVSFIL